MSINNLTIRLPDKPCTLSPLCGKEGIGRELVVRRLASPVQFEG
jgi:hypothetical protein